MPLLSYCAHADGQATELEDAVVENLVFTIFMIIGATAIGLISVTLLGIAIGKIRV